MRLYLLRHSELSRGKKDASPKLTSKGIKSLESLSEFIDKEELSDISEIRHSPEVEAKETAKQFKKNNGLKVKVREVPLLEPYGDFRILASILEGGDETLLLVGHQPNLGMLASYLLTRDSNTELIKIRKSGFLCLERISGQNSKNGEVPKWRIRI